MTVEELDALRLEAARAKLYRDIDEAEDDFAHGRMTEANESQREDARALWPMTLFGRFQLSGTEIG